MVTKADLVELKSLASPPQAIKETMSSVICLLGYPKGQAEDWKFAKKLMASTMLDEMKHFQPKGMSAKKIDYIKGKIGRYSAGEVKAKSAAAESFYTWVTVTLESLPVEESEEKSAV